MSGKVESVHPPTKGPTVPDPTVPDPNDGNISIRGPRASLPSLGTSAPELPYAGDGSRKPSKPRRRFGWLLALLAVIVIGVGALLATPKGSDGNDTAGAKRKGRAAASDTTPLRSPTTERSTSGPSTSGPSTSAPSTTAPSTAASSTTTPSTTATPTTAAPATTATVAVEALPPHEAVYLNGKLYLQGTLPDQAVADRFRQQAEAVIGPANVVVNYQFDPRVPTPVDGHVRVAEQFVFTKGSDAVDPKYLSVFDLGVAVLTINPQATMRIRGYTDDSGSVELNLDLSRRRAQAAADYLISKGINPARLTVLGQGPADPVVPNDTDEHRGQNRRIEVDLYNLLGTAP